MLNVRLFHPGATTLRASARVLIPQTTAFLNIGKEGKETCMKIRPLQDRVIVQRVDEEEKTKGGIIIPDTAKEKPQEGKVVAVGKGKVNDDGKVTPLDVKVGDKILFGKYSGSEIKINGEEFLIMREDDILGVVEGK